MSLVVLAVISNPWLSLVRHPRLHIWRLWSLASEHHRLFGSCRYDFLGHHLWWCFQFPVCQLLSLYDVSWYVCPLTTVPANWYSWLRVLLSHRLSCTEASSRLWNGVAFGWAGLNPTLQWWYLVLFHVQLGPRLWCPQRIVKTNKWDAKGNVITRHVLPSCELSWINPIELLSKSDDAQARMQVVRDECESEAVRRSVSLGSSGWAGVNGHVVWL